MQSDMVDKASRKGMVKVGFVLSGLDAWLGGINYFINLVQAIVDIPQRRIEPVIFLGPRLQPYFSPQVPARCLKVSRFVEVLSSAGLPPRLHYAVYNVWMNGMLRKNGIQVLSHANYAGLRLPLWARIPAVGWIPDFQHLYLPHFFSTEEIQARQRDYGALSARCDGVILSSYAARADFVAQYPEFAAKARVLQFAARPSPRRQVPDVQTLEGRYGFQGPFFFLPNHFWIHKNHGLVLEALAIVKNQGVRVQVLATGNTADYRHQDYFTHLMRRAQDLGVASEFKVLGVIPYSDLLALLHHSLALINPSLFEGWSSTVEEAKARGKIVILSDLPVHREQNPRRGLFFHPRDAAALAGALKQVLESHRPEEEARQEEQARQEARERWQAFGEQYQRLILGFAAPCQEPGSGATTGGPA